MRIDHKTMLEAFEETGGRGDVLSLPRKAVASLAKLPMDGLAPMLQQLFRWFLDGDETHLVDPFADAMLEGLKEQQLQNATRRKAYLVAQAERIKLRWEKNKYQGIPNDTTVYQTKTVTVNGNHKPNQSEVYGFTGDDSGVYADATPESSPTATVLTEAEARQTIASFAPEATEENYGRRFAEAERREGVGEKFAKSERYALDFALKQLDEKENVQTRNALRKFRREGSDILWRALVRFHSDSIAAKKRGKPFDKPGALFITRLKALRLAAGVIARP